MNKTTVEYKVEFAITFDADTGEIIETDIDEYPVPENYYPTDAPDEGHNNWPAVEVAIEELEVMQLLATKATERAQGQFLAWLSVVAHSHG